MVVGIQLVGGVFGLAMIYLTYFYYRRNDFKKVDLILWSSLWIAFLLAISFPNKVNLILETFGVLGALQLFTILAILFLFAVVFYLYRTVRKSQNQVEHLVRDIALHKK